MSQRVIGMSREDCLIVRQAQEEAYRLSLRRIDRELARGVRRENSANRIRSP